MMERCGAVTANLRQPCGGLRGHRPSDCEQIGPDRLGDVLELDWAKIIDRKIEPGSHLAIRVFGEADTVWLRDALQPRSDVDAVAHQVAVALFDDIAQMDADTELDAPLGRQPSIALDHAALDLDRAAHGVDHAAKFDKCAIACPLDDTAVMHGDSRIDQVASECPQSRQCAILIGAG